MKLINILKRLILESTDTFYDSFDYKNYTFKIYGSSHAHDAVSNSAESGRYDVEELSNTIMEFSDTFGKISLDILNDPQKNSILTFDNLLGVNFVTYVNPKGNNTIELKIHTSLKNLRKLNVKPQNKVLIITKSGDTVIKESIDLNIFTKIVRGDIIIYHN